jgi:5-methylcytosine-specific restriction protein B
MTKKEQITTIITQTLATDELQKISSCDDFYFQKGKEAVEEWLNLNLTMENREALMILQVNYDSQIEEAIKNKLLRPILDLIFEIIAYCDLNARDKIIYNKYEDNRVLAKAGVYSGFTIRKID